MKIMKINHCTCEGCQGIHDRLKNIELNYITRTSLDLSEHAISTVIENHIKRLEDRLDALVGRLNAQHDMIEGLDSKPPQPQPQLSITKCVVCDNRTTNWKIINYKLLCKDCYHEALGSRWWPLAPE